MPLGKPGDDGTVVPASRKYRGGAGSLGEATIWKCVGCGKQNDGRRIEEGCVHCGAGTPGTTGPAPTAAEPLAALPTDPGHRPPVRVPTVTPSVQATPQATRVLRLIEYLIAPGLDADAILRRSLVGTLKVSPGVQLTATVIDSINDRQMDLLTLAKRQPGVWLAKPELMDPPDPSLTRLLQVPLPPGIHAGAPGVYQRTLTDAEVDSINQIRKESAMPVPAVGPEFTDEDQSTALVIVGRWGLRFAHTLALALSSIAQELEGNSEPEKFLSSAECLRLASALMAQVPSDWQGDQPEEVPDAQR